MNWKIFGGIAGLVLGCAPFIFGGEMETSRAAAEVLPAVIEVLENARQPSNTAPSVSRQAEMPAATTANLQDHGGPAADAPDSVARQGAQSGSIAAPSLTILARNVPAVLEAVKAISNHFSCNTGRRGCIVPPMEYYPEREMNAKLEVVANSIGSVISSGDLEAAKRMIRSVLEVPLESLGSGREVLAPPGWSLDYYERTQITKLVAVLLEAMELDEKQN